MWCALSAFVGYLCLWFAGGPVGLLLEWLREASGIKGTRSVREKGVPVEIVGSFERWLAFVLVVLVGVGTAYPILIAWLGAKLAASWHRGPVTPSKNQRRSIGAALRDDEDYEAGRKIRAGTLSALLAGIASLTLGILMGVQVQCICQWEAAALY
jgi:hypothetical protein